MNDETRQDTKPKTARPIRRFTQQPLKQLELMRCACCREGVMHKRAITFFRVRLARMVVNLPAVQQHTGLEMMLGGHARLAHTMGVDADMALPVGEGVEFNLCDECAMEHCVAVVDELALKKEEDDA